MEIFLLILLRVIKCKYSFYHSDLILPCTHLICLVLTVPAAQTHLPVTSPTVVSSEPQLPTTDALTAVAQLFQSPHGQEVSFLYKCPCIFFNLGI